MPTFSSKPYRPQSTALSGWNARAKRSPLLFFGLPFILTMVGASFGLSQLTQTRYDHRDMHHRKVAKEEALGMEKNRRQFSLQEEYWRLQAKDDDDDDWEQVRVERPPGADQ